MAENAADIIEWLRDVSNGRQVTMIGIDDGGLALRVVDHPEVYYEIGGIPEDDEDDSDD